MWFRDLIRWKRCVLVSCLLVHSLAPSPTAAQDAKQMYWPALQVSARLDGDGRLHVQERHEMVFNGDWNGGYRRFRVPGGQELDLHGVRRIDAHSGREVPLVAGDIDQVDHYVRDGDSVRWRSRLPSDPPFVMQRLSYVLDYTLSYILTGEEDGVFRLSHDFAFPDRDSLIERVHVDLELDKDWQPVDDVPATLSRESLMPGDSLILDARLRHSGVAPPAGVWLPASRAARVAIMAAVLGACGMLFVFFLYGEARLGRFRPLQSPQAIDEAWLEANLLRFLPEEAGAAWDGRIGAPEVAAVLARLVAEGKLETTIKESWFLFIPMHTLTMRITPAGKTGKRSYEATLVQKLFVKGETETDTDKIREHYKRSGFDPAAQIRSGLETALRRHPELCDTRPAPPRWPIVALLAAAAGIALVGAAQQPDAIGAALVTLIGSGGVFVLSSSCAVWWRQRLTRWWLTTPLLLSTALIPTAALAAVSFTDALTPLLRPDLSYLTGLAGLAVAIFAGTLRSATSLDGPQRLAARQRLAAARRFFARELRQPAPRLRDAWFPYVVAFGLGARAARWFRRFGAATQTVGRGSSGTWTSGGSTSTGPAASGTWSGGAGKFGGAGAGGAWVAALGTVAAGVSEPSKSGGSGGGGGGSSSGGGGGGGW